ncbi:MAG: peptidoglycan bridge formation glycyltransferase FemA/FemB family protein [Nitrospirota bacterium]
MEIKSCLTGKRGVSLPFTDYCEPVISNDINFQDIFDSIIEWGKKAGWKYIEIRGGGNFCGNVPASDSYYGHYLDLRRDEDEIFSRFRNSTKRNIKKALNEGVEVEICNTLDSIKEFYRLNCLTRKRHGLPPQPYYFFQNIYDYVISKNYGTIVRASYERETIAGAVYFHFGNKAIYKYGASDNRFQQLRANNLVMWEAIKYYCNNGYTNFSFGRTDLEHEGLRQFKSGWGTKEKTIKYYKYSLRKHAYLANKESMFSFHTKVFRIMPVQVSKFIGKLLYQHAG